MQTKEMSHLQELMGEVTHYQVLTREMEEMPPLLTKEIFCHQ